MKSETASPPADAGEVLDRLHRTWRRLRLSAPLRAAIPAWAIRAARYLRALILTRRLLHGERFAQASEDASASAFLSIVVPIHDAPAVLERCLKSLERYAGAAQVILVDDASELTGTQTIVAQYSERNRWTVLRNQAALGHSEACRKGADRATRPYLCLLNSDTVVTPWCWRQVKEAFEQDGTIGALGPSTSESKNQQRIPVASHCRNYWSDDQICEFAAWLRAQPPQPALLDLPAITGFAFFIRRSLWQQFGGFDRNLPDYGNETELCGRLRGANYRTVWMRHCYIHHFGSRSYSSAVGQEGILARKRAAAGYIAERLRSSQQE